MDEQVGSRIIQLSSLVKPEQSYKEDGQLRKILKPTRKSMGKPDSFGEEEGEIVEDNKKNLQLANMSSRSTLMMRMILFVRKIWLNHIL